MCAAMPGAVNLQVGFRLATRRFPLAAPTMALMRAAIAALAALGYGALVAALGVSLAAGDGWLSAFGRRRMSAHHRDIRRGERRRQCTAQEVRSARRARS
jgi:hypothetical protein